MRRSTARSSSSEYCSSRACVCSAPTAPGLPPGLESTVPARASSSCRTEEKVFLRSWVMRLCSTEGVLQLATCNKSPEVGWKNREEAWQQMYEKEGPHLGSLPPKKGLHAQQGMAGSSTLQDQQHDQRLQDGGRLWVTRKAEPIRLWHHLRFVSKSSFRAWPCWTAPMSTVAKRFLNMKRDTVKNYTGTTGIN